MIDRRKLIRLAIENFNGEQPFVEIKESLSLAGARGQGKFLKEICALANSNPTTNSYLIIGITDENRRPVGVEYLDDQKIQALVAHYLFPAPAVVYENIRWEGLGDRKYIGLIRIAPAQSLVRVAHPIWKLRDGACYYRRGTESIEGLAESFSMECRHSGDLLAWEQAASTNLSLILAALVKFQGRLSSLEDLNYRVFGERHVLCWKATEYDELASGFLGELTLELLTEGVTYFWSCLQPVTLTVDDTSACVTEYVCLWWKARKMILPLSDTRISFGPDGDFRTTVERVFVAPVVSAADIDALVARCREITRMARSREPIDEKVWYESETLPYELAVAALNGSVAARAALEEFLAGVRDGALAECQAEALQIVMRANGEMPIAADETSRGP